MARRRDSRTDAWLKGDGRPAALPYGQTNEWGGNLRNEGRPVLLRRDPSGLIEGYSTTSSTIVPVKGGGFAVVPTVVDGVDVGEEGAYRRFRETGEHWGRSATLAGAEEIAQAVHDRHEAMNREMWNEFASESLPALAPAVRQAVAAGDREGVRQAAKGGRARRRGWTPNRESVERYSRGWYHDANGNWVDPSKPVAPLQLTRPAKKTVDPTKAQPAKADPKGTAPEKRDAGVLWEPWPNGAPPETPAGNRYNGKRHDEFIEGLGTLRTDRESWHQAEKARQEGRAKGTQEAKGIKVDFGGELGKMDDATLKGVLEKVAAGRDDYIDDARRKVVDTQMALHGSSPDDSFAAYLYGSKPLDYEDTGRYSPKEMHKNGRNAAILNEVLDQVGAAPKSPMAMAGVAGAELADRGQARLDASEITLGANGARLDAVNDRLTAIQARVKALKGQAEEAEKAIVNAPATDVRSAIDNAGKATAAVEKRMETWDGKYVKNDEGKVVPSYQVYEVSQPEQPQPEQPQPEQPQPDRKKEAQGVFRGGRARRATLFGGGTSSGPRYTGTGLGGNFNVGGRDEAGRYFSGVAGNPGSSVQVSSTYSQADANWLAQHTTSATDRRIVGGNAIVGKLMDLKSQAMDWQSRPDRAAGLATRRMWERFREGFNAPTGYEQTATARFNLAGGDEDPFRKDTSSVWGTYDYWKVNS